MTAIKHIRFANDLIETARPRWLWTQNGIPGAQIVELQISKFPRIGRDDELRHIGMIEIAADEFELLRRVVPPLVDMRRSEPSLDRRQGGGRHRAERVGRHAQPPCNVSMVTLRLV